MNYTHIIHNNNAPIKVMPHYPPSGHMRGHLTVIEPKQRPGGGGGGVGTLNSVIIVTIEECGLPDWLCHKRTVAI